MPPGVEGEYYVYVIANSAGRNPIAGDIVRSGSNSGLLGQFSKSAFELPQGNLGQASFPVVYAEPDLRVTELTLPEEMAAGSTVTISFTVENGRAPGRERVCKY